MRNLFTFNSNPLSLMAEHQDPDLAERLLHTPQRDPEAEAVEMSEQTIPWRIQPIVVLVRVVSSFVATVCFARRHVIGLLITAALVPAGELATRSIAPGFGRRTYDAWTTGSYPIAMNPAGHRGPDVPEAVVPGQFRLLALGDSVTFGTGVAWHEAWPHRIGAHLDGSSPPLVVNTGIPATDLDQVRLLVEGRWSQPSPDAVMLMLTGNMVSLAWIRRDQVPKIRENQFVAALSRERPTGARTRLKRMVSRSALAGFLFVYSEAALYQIGLLGHHVDTQAPYGPMLAHGWRQADLDPAVTEHAWEFFRQQLAALGETCRIAGVPLIVSYAPPRFMMSNRLLDNAKAVPRERIPMDPVARARTVCNDLEIPFVDVREALIGSRRKRSKVSSLYLVGDYTHFDAVGHDVVAAAMAEGLNETLLRTAQRTGK